MISDISNSGAVGEIGPAFPHSKSWPGNGLTSGADAQGDVNRALPEAVQARGRAFVTGTVFGGRETLRACILHPDTDSEHLATLVAEVVATARTLAAAG